MFVSIDFILYLCYRITLFLLFLILITKLFKDYLLPQIHEYINQIKKHKEDILFQRNLTKNTIARIEKLILEQDIQLANLENKIKYWHNELLADTKHALEKNKTIIEKLNEKRKIQTRILHLEKTQQEILPKAIEEAKKEFIEFAQKEGHNLLAKLIIVLERKLS